MKRKQTVLVTLLLLISLIYAKPAQSSWVGLTTQELIQKSDVILIGDVIGPVRVGKGNPQGIDNYWMTYWKIKVHYYLKGNQESIDFFVVTPGAENTWSKTSLDFRLDEWGKSVILFLRERDGIFEPLSPQGIMNLDRTNYFRKTDESVDGKLVLKEFQLDSENNSDLKKFILADSSVVISKNVPSKQRVPIQRSNLPLILGSVLFMALVLSIIAFFIKRFVRNSHDGL